ncbi:eukaryotic translation initiation factor 2D-like isoform X2 [Antedon mediterranea]
MSVLKLYTHNGTSVIVYCLGKNPLFFEQDKQLFPTVYTLWKFPNILPYFTTWPPVLEKLQGGADLMLPGVVKIGDLPTVGKGDVCGVNLVGNQAAVGVGVAHWSTEDMLASGMRGKGVLTLHTYGDQLWEYGDKTTPPQIPMKCLNMEDSQQLADDAVAEHTGADGTGADGTGAATDGSQSATDNTQEDSGATQECSNEINQLTLEHTNEMDDEEVEEEPLEERVAKMDVLLMECFLFSLKYVKKSDLPLLASTFYAQHVQKCCPSNKSIDIKKTSFKKLSKFLQHMKERGLLELKEPSKGVISIVGVDKSHDDLRKFVVPEELEQSRATTVALDEVAKKEEARHSYQAPEVVEMLGVTSAMVPIFQPQYKKGSWLLRNMVKDVVTDYVKENQLVDANDPSMIVLDPHLSDAVVNKGEYITHLKWDQLFTRFYDKMQGGYQVAFPGEVAGSKSVKKGKIQPINISVVQKAGNKKVTLVTNLEVFKIDPKQFAHDVQVGVATSTSVSSLPGKNAGVQVLVQGNQIEYIATVLIDKYGLARKYISGVEKGKGKKR